MLDISPLIGHIICKYFLPFSRLSFHFLDGFLCSAEALSLIGPICLLFIFAFVCLEFSSVQSLSRVRLSETP